LKPGDGKFI